MQRLFAILLLLTFALQTGSSWAVMGWFVVNQAQIIEQDCINKDRPLLHCNGKCLLAEKLRLAETEDAGTPGTVEVYPPLLPLFSGYAEPVFVALQIAPASFPEIEPASYPPHTGNIFHPPRI